MRIAVFGNCTVDTIAACLGLLLPGVEVEAFWARPQAPHEALAFRDRLGSFDVVCGHRSWQGPLAAAEAEARSHRFIGLPWLTFSGFQPDNVMNHALHSPLGHAHSALIIAAFLNAVPQPRVASLFNAFVYASLGYFNRFDEERSRLLRVGVAEGFDLSSCLDAWPRPSSQEVRQPSHHDILHPAYETIAGFATLLAPMIGSPVTIDFANPAIRAQADRTRFNATWPIYPEIAQRLRIHPTPMRFSFSGRVTADLEEFIAGSYSLYKAADRMVLEAAAGPEQAALAKFLAGSS